MPGRGECRGRQAGRRPPPRPPRQASPTQRRVSAACCVRREPAAPGMKRLPPDSMRTSVVWFSARKKPVASRRAAKPGRSLSVWTATARAPEGSASVYHQPSGTASTVVKELTSSSRAATACQHATSRSKHCRPASRPRRATAARRPVASTTTAQRSVRSLDGVRARSIQPRPLSIGWTKVTRAGRSSKAPRAVAVSSSRRSNTALSTRQPAAPCSEKRNRVWRGTTSPQAARLP